MNKFEAGIKGALVGILVGIVQGTVLAAFVKDGILPSGVVYLITFAGLVAAVLAILALRSAGIIFTLGWIAGALILKDMFSTLDFIVYLVAPIIMLVLLIYFAFRNASDGG